MIGVIGQDGRSFVERRLADFDVSSDSLIVSEKQTGVTVSVSIAEQRTLFSYQGANGILPSLIRENTAILARGADSRHVHLAMPIDDSVADSLLLALHSRGATLTLDVGYQAEWLRSSSSLNILRRLDYFMPNEKEAQLMCGSVDEYLRYCNESGCDGLVKLGSAGAVMVTDGEWIRVGAPDVEVVDTTGAGDAFDAGFIDGLLDRKPAKDCLELACICGALSTRSSGSLASLPTREDVELFRTIQAT